jgi:hypothetical protein
VRGLELGGEGAIRSDKERGTCIFPSNYHSPAMVLFFFLVMANKIHNL